MDRKRFLTGACATTFAVALAGCGGSGDDGASASPTPTPSPSPSPTPSGNCTANGTTVQIGANHGHSLSVPAGDVSAGVEKTYDIQGTSDHPHAVTVTAAHFTELQANMSVVIASTSGGGHTHQVTVSCA